jgi:hypothetical protein
MRIPTNYDPRFYQIPFLSAMDRGMKRACLVWHRRSGKSKTLLNFTIKQAMQRVGSYYHCFPEYNQGKKILWDGSDKEGHRILDYHIPQEIRRSTNQTELKIELTSGSIWQIVGADHYDSIVGTNPVGLILDEWAVSDKYPMAWDLLRPILDENQGWAVFPYTPRGRNHGFTLYQMAQRNPEWYCDHVTVTDSGAISLQDIQSEREAGMSEDMIQQEFFCSFVASTEDIVIPYEFIQSSLTRDVSFSGSPKFAGLDVARFGDDRTALIIRQGGEIQHVGIWRGADTVTPAGKVIDAYNRRLFDVVAVDAIGIGAGVEDQLRYAGVPTGAVNVAESSAQSERFQRLRDELWWAVREFFMSRTCSISQGIRPQIKQQIIADIQDIHYDYTPVGKIKIEDKAEMKKRLGFSPDIGDALCLTFHPALRTAVDIEGREVNTHKAFEFTNWRKKPKSEGYQKVRV